MVLSPAFNSLSPSPVSPSRPSASRGRPRLRKEVDGVVSVVANYVESDSSPGCPPVQSLPDRTLTCRSWVCLSTQPSLTASSKGGSHSQSVRWTKVGIE